MGNPLLMAIFNIKPWRISRASAPESEVAVPTTVAPAWQAPREYGIAIAPSKGIGKKKLVINLDK